MQQEKMPPEKLLLAGEPESAAMHCRRKAKVAGKGGQYMVKAEKYLVVDIGGGTVDIASHRIVGSHVKEIAPPAGRFFGGTTVNENFSKFLEEFVENPRFSHYIYNNRPEIQVRQRVDLNKLLYMTFETQKKRFGSGEDCDSYVVEFPNSFSRVYRDSLVKSGSALKLKGDMSVQVEDDGERMRIFPAKMAEFFLPTINNILQLIQLYLHKHKIANTIEAIYWVGGFGGCEYLRKELERGIGETFRGCNYQFPVPPDPELAVIRGATAFHCDPSIVTERKVPVIENVTGES